MFFYHLVSPVVCWLVGSNMFLLEVMDMDIGQLQTLLKFVPWFECRIEMAVSWKRRTPNQTSKILYFSQEIWLLYRVQSTLHVGKYL